MTLREFVRQLIKEYEGTQAAFAEHIGADATALSRWLNKRRHNHWYFVERLADTYPARTMEIFAACNAEIKAEARR